ncbi:homoserine dehydrogenase [Novosphingobium sp. MBES04]|uniref:homoserine dehydrogenase n=1 Tax=Novosphingobium sp. MBES04 TaxID=1206458 RepID=UPI0007237078|nr:homoserine dehydrogenase [Novosphingobium sp. MBES04]GAM05664.1 homoserine dehydrogenase [Novosphingobium sp. MBES04]
MPSEALRPVTVAIAGYGNIGRQVAVTLLERRVRYAQVHGCDVRLVAVCGSRTGAASAQGFAEASGIALEDGRTGPEFLAEIAPDVLIEAGPTDFATGGPALGYLTMQLGAGRDAVVVSKGALVHSGARLRELARASGAALRISGATAAALPTIDLIETGLRGAKVLALEGVFNATTNFLLNAMMARGCTFAEALGEAQAGGFAERDPSRDIEGWDTACKLTILANFGLDAGLALEDVAVSGIGDVTPERVALWKAQGQVPRLVGRLDCTGDAPVASVAVRTYPLDHAFAHIPGKTKALRVETDCMGEILTMGGGPEPLATSCAALKDFELVLEAQAGRG